MSILVLDTSVLVKLKGKQATTTSVNSLLSRHGDLVAYISEMTFFEFLKCTPHKKDLLKSKEILQNYKQILIDTPLIKYTTGYFIVLMNYKDQELKRVVDPNQLSDSDSLIGATAMRSNALICTTNRNDFPHPFFDEIDSE
jgi:predicted nucleic acid-binding protein